MSESKHTPDAWKCGRCGSTSDCDDQMPRHEADCHEFAGSTVKRDLLVAAMDALAATEGGE